MTADYVTASHTWVVSGHGVGAAADALAQAVDVLCGALGALGDCWGNDDIGRAFFNGDDKTAGFGASRDALLADLADMVNLLRATGGSLILAGHTFRLAEEAGTLGAKLPKGADEGALAAERPYRLPAVADALVESDPPPSGFEEILYFLEILVGGCQWPDGNLDSLAALRDAFYAAGGAVRATADEVGGHARNVCVNNVGKTVEKFATFAAALRGGGEQGGLLWLADVCKGLGDSVDFLIREKRAAREQFELSLVFLAATWAIAWAISWLTAGSSIAAATATTEAEGFVLKTFLQTVAKAVAQGMWYAGGMDAVGQYARIQQGVQKGFNKGEFFKAIGEGGLAGGVMGAAGGAVAARNTRLTAALADWMGAAGLKGAGARFLFAGTTGTAGNIAAQAALEGGHVDLAQAAGFGFGMAGMGAAGEAGRHFAGRLGLPGRPGTVPGDPTAGGTGGEGPGSRTTPPFADDGTPNPRNDYVHTSDSGLGYHLKGEVIARDGVPVSGTPGDHGRPAGGAGDPQTGSGQPYGGATHPAGRSYDGGQSYDGGRSHDGPSSSGGQSHGGLQTHGSGQSDGAAASGSTSHADLAAVGGHKGGADLPTPAAAAGHSGEAAVPPVPEPATRPTVLMTPGDGGVNAGQPHGPGGAAVAGLPGGDRRSIVDVLGGAPRPPRHEGPAPGAHGGSGAEPGRPRGTAEEPSSRSGGGEASRIERLLNPSHEPNPSREEARSGAAETPSSRTGHPDGTGPTGRQEPERAGEPPTRQGPTEPTAPSPETPTASRAETPTAPRTGTSGEEPAPEPRPEIHPPRYTDYGALGDGTAVEGARLPADPHEAARRWAEDLPDYLPPRLRAEIETRVRYLLGDPNPDRWTDLLQNGIAFESRGHVVWLKPRLDAYTHVQPPEGARRYTVSFGGSGAGAKETVRTHRDNSAGVVEMLDNSDGLERVSLPGPGVSKVSGRAHTATTEVMAGHKTVAFKHDFFDWTVRVEAHVDGSEAGIGGAVDGVSLTVPFPEQFHREGTPGGGGDRPPMPRHLVASDRAPDVRKHDVIVTAVQPDRLVTEFQRRALQAGMSPKRVAEVVNRELASHIGQQILLNRSRDLLNGELTTPDATITSRVLRLEQLPAGDTPIRQAVLRDDQGLLTTTNDSRQFGHRWNVTAGMKLGVDNPAAKFFARIGGSYQGGKNHVLSYSHTTLPKITLVRKDELARYHAIVRMEVQTRFGGFPVDVPMELAVRASDASRFERDLLGGVKTAELGAAHPDGDGPGAPDHGSIVPAGPEHSPPVAPHEPHPAEPAHLAAGHGAGLGKLTALPGSEQVVRGLRDAIDEALPNLPEPARRQLVRDLDARFGRSALEGVSLSDLLHGGTHRITVGGHRIEISHRAELGERRSAEEFDMTVNDRKVAGAGTSAGQSRSSGVGVEVAGNVRFALGEFGLDAPKVALHGGGSRSKTVSFMGGTTEYRRTETDGPVTQITKEMRHEVTLRVHDGGKQLTDRSWTVRGDDVSARVVVPQEHRPAAAVTPEEVAKVGRVERVDALPDDRIDFAGQTTAVFPSIAAAHDLPFEVARVEAEANGRPAPADLLGIPPEILDATRPSSLEAHLADLTSRDGWRIQVTQPGGTTRGVTLRAGFGRPEHAVARTGIEIEHYRAANSRMRVGTSTDLRVEGELKAGFRGKVTTAHTEFKGVGEAGGVAEVDRRRGTSAYTGASDVIRGTYSSGGLTHSFSGSDLYLSVTPDVPAGRHAPTTHLRVHGGAEFMMPDRIARDHHLAASPDVHGHDGEPVVARPVSEPRTYRPDLAITSAHVERFDGRDVLPKVESMLEGRGLLPEGDAVARELLRAAFGEPALAANMASLRRGVVQWYPVESAYGFTRHVGVRVRAVLEGGAHTAERPDVGHMARVQGLGGSEAVRERGFGRGWKGLVRGTAEGASGGGEHGRSGGEHGPAGGRHGHGKGATGGGQFGGGRIHRSETGHSDGVGVKDIDRRQTREGSQEFTHGLRYEIEVVESKEPPHGLEHGVNAIRRGADALTRLTGNDVASRYFDRHLSVETETATVGGGVRLVVPHHLTTVAGEGADVPGWEPVTGRFPRWSDHTPPTEVNRALGGMVGRISFPGAEVVHEYAPLAALPPERRGPVPARTERPTGFELSRPQGMTLWRQTDSATLMSEVTSLLDHTYEVAGLRPEETVTVGMNVVGLKEDAQALLKRREYSQTATTQRDGVTTATDAGLRGGGSVGSSGGHGGMASHGRGRGSAVAGEADGSNIRERNIEVTDQNVMYSADVVLVFHREGARDLLVDVADALHIRLTEDAAAELDRRHPGLIRRPAGIENPPAPKSGGLLASPGGREAEPVPRPEEGRPDTP
ncbi:hypothetical protein AB0L00_10325 [Actinoallomurus sp. NPDC052308]|uniref:hypothetical protein n=1 Tax=Actinoallomurus sp. NPDC052308 TaxID=3155530 RepID=UPI003416739C